jgi:hypothetical protein
VILRGRGRQVRAAFLSLAAVVSCAAFAQSQTLPLQTEGATTAAPKTLQLELGQDIIRREPNYQTGGERTRCDGPLLRLVYAPATGVEFDIEWVSRVRASGDPDLGDVADWGDVTLRAKLRLLDGGAGKPSLATRFWVALPQATYAKTLGPNTLRTAVEALLTQPLGSLRFHANAGLLLHDEVTRPHEQRDFLAYGAAVEARATTRLALLTEVAGRLGKGKPGADEHAEWRIGFRCRLGRTSLAAALRRGLEQADGTWGLTTGLSIQLRGANPAGTPE